MYLLDDKQRYLKLKMKLTSIFEHPSKKNRRKISLFANPNLKCFFIISRLLNKFLIKVKINFFRGIKIYKNFIVSIPFKNETRNKPNILSLYLSNRTHQITDISKSLLQTIKNSPTESQFSQTVLNFLHHQRQYHQAVHQNVCDH